MYLENLVMTQNDWEIFCAEYEDWLQNYWMPFIGGEENEPQA